MSASGANITVHKVARGAPLSVRSGVLKEVTLETKGAGQVYTGQVQLVTPTLRTDVMLAPLVSNVRTLFLLLTQTTLH